jgi:hypothetical protein
VGEVKKMEKVEELKDVFNFYSSKLLETLDKIVGEKEKQLQELSEFIYSLVVHEDLQNDIYLRFKWYSSPEVQVYFITPSGCYYYLGCFCISQDTPFKELKQKLLEKRLELIEAAICVFFNEILKSVEQAQEVRKWR